MATDTATFKTVFPEFQDAPAPLVDAKLAQALTLTPTEVWGDDGDGTMRQQGVFYYTARFLALSPFARNMALVNKAGVTSYDVELQRLKSIVASGFRSL